ncbi:phosphoribosyltransferase [Nitratireductor basaltis]|uniref:Phosphoribosyltransferase n=1 Tax=Nitratireductor basaltis TaxID=472175 RepID=A0A084U956_9HYPH|nr:phosphoribosyltransferase [Nitratireductor basaltis]KFB09492.1 hypothetical protein EL18_00508 [Nitratireductor basaltis]
MGQATQWFFSENGYSFKHMQKCPERARLFLEYSASPDPNLLFLDQTLLQRVKVHKRGATSYFSVRAWRQNVRELQLKAMRNLKRTPSEENAQHIASEIVAAARLLTNGAAYDCVCPVPAGSSGKTNNFATIIAWYVARELNLPMYRALQGCTMAASAHKSTSSHPMQSRHFRSKLVDARVREKFCLLVDDVATTGVHFERCTAQLAKMGSPAVCVCWIA